MSVINVFAAGARKNEQWGNGYRRRRLHKHPKGVFLFVCFVAHVPRHPVIRHVHARTHVRERTFSEVSQSANFTNTWMLRFKKMKLTRISQATDTDLTAS